jgi:capsular exopolysaccharide synthesis family protein
MPVPPPREVTPEPVRPAVASPFRKPPAEQGKGPETELEVEVPDGVDDHMVSLVKPASFEAEQYRALRHMVELLHRSSNVKLIAVSSPSTGDGKTVTAVNLAGALAQDLDARVLLVDADLRRPRIAHQLALGPNAGRGLVGAIVNGDTTLAQAVRRRASHNLFVLPAGSPPSAPYELLQSPRAAELMAEARANFDYVVLDTPPLIAVPDCRVIAGWVDGFLIVVKAHRTPRKLVEESLNVLEPAKTIGFVFNADERSLSGYSNYLYTYSRNGHDHAGGIVERARALLPGRRPPRGM